MLVTTYLLPSACVSFWLACYPSVLPSQGSAQTPFVPVDERPLDSLTVAFLATARDSAATWGTPSSSLLAFRLTQALQRQGVTTLLYYSSSCVGCQRAPTAETPPCSCSEAEIYSYLYWQYQGRTFVKELDCCRNHPAQLTTSEPFDFYDRNRRLLEQGAQAERAARRHAQQYSTKPQYRTIPINQGASHVQLTRGSHQLSVTVWEGEYSRTGQPRTLNNAWRLKQWAWTTRLKQLASGLKH